MTRYTRIMLSLFAIGALTMLACTLASCSEHPHGADRPNPPAEDDYVPRRVNPVDNGLPPVRFRGAPPHILVNFAYPSEIARLCGYQDRRDVVVEGCTRMAEGRTPVMILPHPSKVDPRDFARISAHEIGHVNGWPGNHGG